MLNSQVATLPLIVIRWREEGTEPEKDLGVAVGTPGKVRPPRTKTCGSLHNGDGARSSMLRSWSLYSLVRLMGFLIPPCEQFQGVNGLIETSSGNTFHFQIPPELYLL